MAYRAEIESQTIVFVDGRGQEVASLELMGNDIEIENQSGMTDITTDDEPEGVRVMMLLTEE